MTRFLSESEKQREVAAFADYRADESNFRTAHPEAKGGEGWIDPEILPLVDALNELRGVCTIQSCCGHRWAIPDDPEGAEHVHRGQLWLRLSEPVTREVERRIGELLAHDVIVHATKLYAFQEMAEPHEVFDVMFREGALREAEPILLDFFTQCEEWDV